MKFAVCLLVAALCGVPWLVEAQTVVPTDLSRASLEELMSIDITTLSRKSERATDAEGAIYVITQQDIRRSGITLVPELFRLVPGMQVAQINANNWAISVRGLGSLFTNNLLVLVDGRSVYNQAFSGVYWSAQDLLLDDIDHIEVIRGPGGAVWGANAVNGVINIITKAATLTPGLLVQLGTGSYDSGLAAARYGGSVGRLAYRVSSQWSNHSGSSSAPGITAPDDWRSLTNNIRLDWTAGSDTIMLQSGIVTAKGDAMWVGIEDPRPALPQPTGVPFQTRNFMVNARWTHTRANGASFQLQAINDLRHRPDSGVTEDEAVREITAQYQTTIGARHGIVFGIGYRHDDSTTAGEFGYLMIPPHRDEAVTSGFVQDEISLGRRLHMTVGSKMERSSNYGWQLQPTARLGWAFAASQRVWGAVSRAVRTPSVQDQNVRISYLSFAGEGGVPVLLGIVGNPNYQTEQLVEIESGYRAELGAHAAFDVAAYQGHYRNLSTDEPLPASFAATPPPAHVFLATQFDNLLDAESRGVEIAGHWTPYRSWRLDGSYSWFHLSPHLRAQSLDASAGHYDGDAPGHQWQIHAAVQLTTRAELTAGAFYVGALTQLGVPAYTRADAGLNVHVGGSVWLAIAGHNLLQRTHPEYIGGRISLTPTLVPRSASAQVSWRFERLH